MSAFDDFLETCDLCHDYFDIQQIRVTPEGHFYCDHCQATTHPLPNHWRPPSAQYHPLVAETPAPTTSSPPLMTVLGG